MRHLRLRSGLAAACLLALAACGGTADPGAASSDLEAAAELEVAADLEAEATEPGSEAGEPAGASAADDARLAELERRIAALERRKSRLEDVNAVKRLQRSYGYYLDEGLWDQAVDLFAEDATLEVGLDGVYAGKERIREYFLAIGGGRAGLAEGRLNEHMQLMPVITVAPDGASALGRWRALVMIGDLGERAWWGEGPYENEYVKEDGVWKIRRLHWYQSVVVPYEGGWQENEDVNGGVWVSDRLPPDAPPSVEYGTWPATYLPPFHFSNPVTGE